MSDDFKALRGELVFQLEGGYAHARFEDVVADFPSDLRGAVPHGLPYSAWQLLEHIRIAQHDIVAFSKNADGRYKELTWPDDYWQKSPEPPKHDAWDHSIQGILTDRAAMVQMVSDEGSDLLAPFPWGDGQTLLREAMLIVDHAGYHLGELVALRRILNVWPPKSK